MPIERRLAAALLLLVGALPLLSVYLPARPEALAAPLIALACTSGAVLVPSTPTLQRLGGIAGALALVLFDLSATAMVSVGIFAVFPLMLMVLRVPALMATLSVLGSLAVIGGWFGTQVMSMHVLAVGSVGDTLGVCLALGWVLWLALSLVQLWLARRHARAIRAACHELQAATLRDRRDLSAIVTCLADPSLTPPLEGQGLDSERLHLASRLDGSDLLLVGSLTGHPLATLSVGWALRAAASAGQHDAGELRRFAQQELDEVNAPDNLEWLAIVRADGRTVSASPKLKPGPPPPVRSFDSPLQAENTGQTLDELLPMPAELVARPSEFLAALIDLGVMVVTPVAYLAMPTSSMLWGLLPFAVGIAAQLVTQFRAQTTARRTSRLESQFESLVECRDDLHHQLARLHGSLLPYQVEVGELLATAHRLRGDVLDGSFADMLLVDDERAKVLAGEVAGEGIAARFLGLAAQAAMRTRVTANRPGDTLYHDVRSVLSSAATRLEFPLHLQLGVVEFDRGGAVVGFGSLANMVVVGAPPQPTPSLRERAQLDEHTHVYLTPAGSRPGPDDTAPVLTAPLAAQRVAHTIARGDWRAEQDGLASLFSLVFDGVDAPAHGTLIRLERRQAA